ncbi:MAG TPA: hypothetical protein VGF39_16540 [Stellaceae bacterium]
MTKGSGAPPNVIAAAARTLLELAGALGRNREPDQEDSPGDLDPESLTLEEIEREILRTGEV